MPFKNGVLEASGLDFGGPRTRFSRGRAQFSVCKSIRGNARLALLTDHLLAVIAGSPPAKFVLTAQFAILPITSTILCLDGSSVPTIRLEHPILGVLSSRIGYPMWGSLICRGMLILVCACIPCFAPTVASSHRGHSNFPHPGRLQAPQLTAQVAAVAWPRAASSFLVP